MKSIKRYLGIVWILAAPVLVAFMVWQAYEKISASAAAAKTNAFLQWLIIILVFIPICIGFIIFGWYAFRGEYDEE
jgi:cytochrome bd-type quinol oxidase subunit 2